MITRYRLEEYISELTEIQDYIHWGMTCKNHRVSYMYSEQMTIDSNPLRSIDDIINSKYASCLEFSILMKHTAKTYSLPCKQIILPRNKMWAMHGMIIIDDVAVSMGNYIEVFNTNYLRPMIEIEFNAGESRKCMYERMLAKL